jgi:hypothetical protein
MHPCLQVCSSDTRQDIKLRLTYAPMPAGQQQRHIKILAEGSHGVALDTGNTTAHR